MRPQEWHPPFQLPAPDCRPAGYAALVQRHELDVLPHWRWTFVGRSHMHRRMERGGIQYEVLPPPRWPGENDIDHFLFALRYEAFASTREPDSR